MKIPSSFRFPEWLMDKLKARAESKNRSLTEHVQTVLEASIENENFEKKQYYEFIADPEKSISNIYEKLFRETDTKASCLSLSEIKFMIHYCHEAYLYYSGIVSNNYINVIVDITLELIKVSLKDNIQFDKYYVYRCLDLSDENFNKDINELRNVINNGVYSSYAEYLSRPLESNAFELHTYQNKIIDSIFTKERLKKIFPLVVRGIIGRDESKWKINITSQNIPSQKVSFSVSDFSFSIDCHGNDIKRNESASVYFLIEGNHFIQPCTFKKMLAVIRLINFDNMGREFLFNDDSDKVSIYSPQFKSDNAIIDLDSFRIFLSFDEYNDFKVKFLESIQDEKIAMIINAMKNIQGDI